MHPIGYATDATFAFHLASVSASSFHLPILMKSSDALFWRKRVGSNLPENVNRRILRVPHAVGSESLTLSPRVQEVSSHRAIRLREAPDLGRTGEDPIPFCRKLRCLPPSVQGFQCLLANRTTLFRTMLRSTPIMARCGRCSNQCAAGNDATQRCVRVHRHGSVPHSTPEGGFDGLV